MFDVVNELPTNGRRNDQELSDRRSPPARRYRASKESVKSRSETAAQIIVICCPAGTVST